METLPWENASQTLKTKWPVFETEVEALYHAIGCVVVRWNDFEAIIENFLSNSKIPDSVVSFIAHKMHNADRTALLLLLGEELYTSDAEIDRNSKLFFSYASICAENRNFVAHAQILGQKNKEGFRMRKANKNKPGTYEDVYMAVENVRSMAEDILNTTLFSARFLSVTGKVIKGTDNELEPLSARSMLEAPPKPVKWRAYKNPIS